MEKQQLSPHIITLHQDAVKEGRQTYVDPETGYTVFTSDALMKRGYCCGSMCRHCPFDYENVPKG